MDDDSGRLLKDMIAGSEDAFTAFVRRYQAKVRSYLGRFIRDAAAVDDLAQETFIAAFKSLDTFKGDSGLSLWLLGIARNLALKHVRERSRAGPRVSLELALASWCAERAEGGGAPESRHEGLLTALRQCLESLREHGGKLVREHYFKGRPAAEIARELGKTEGAVWVALLRIRGALRQCIDSRMAGA